MEPQEGQVWRFDSDVDQGLMTIHRVDSAWVYFKYQGNALGVTFGTWFMWVRYNYLVLTTLGG